MLSYFYVTFLFPRLLPPFGLYICEGLNWWEQSKQRLRPSLSHLPVTGLLHMSENSTDREEGERGKGMKKGIALLDYEPEGTSRHLNSAPDATIILVRPESPFPFPPTLPKGWNGERKTHPVITFIIFS